MMTNITDFFQKYDDFLLQTYDTDCTFSKYT